MKPGLRTVHGLAKQRTAVRQAGFPLPDVLQRAIAAWHAEHDDAVLTDLRDYGAAEAHDEPVGIFAAHGVSEDRSFGDVLAVIDRVMRGGHEAFAAESELLRGHIRFGVPCS